MTKFLIYIPLVFIGSLSFSQTSYFSETITLTCGLPSDDSGNLVMGAGAYSLRCNLQNQESIINLSNCVLMTQTPGPEIKKQSAQLEIIKQTPRNVKLTSKDNSLLVRFNKRDQSAVIVLKNNLESECLK